MLGKLHDALIVANVPPDKAREAAEEVAAYEASLADVRSTQRLHTWILSFNTAMLAGILWKLFGT